MSFPTSTTYSPPLTTPNPTLLLTHSPPLPHPKSPQPIHQTPPTPSRPTLSNSPPSTQHAIKQQIEIHLPQAPLLPEQIPWYIRQRPNDIHILQTRSVREHMQQGVADGGAVAERLHGHRGRQLGAVQEASVAGHEEFVEGDGFAVGEVVDGEGEAGGEEGGWDGGVVGGGDDGCVVEVGVGRGVVVCGGRWAELMMNVAAAAAGWKSWWAGCGWLDGDCAEDSFFPSECEEDVGETIVAHHVIHREPDGPHEESRNHSRPGDDLDGIVVRDSVRLGWWVPGKVSIGDLGHEVQYVHETRFDWKRRSPECWSDTEAWIWQVSIQSDIPDCNLSTCKWNRSRQ